MPSKEQATKVKRKAHELLKSGEFGDNLVLKSGHVENALPVYSPQGKIEYWFVPITIRDKLVSFMQFDMDLKMTRYSTFQHRPSTLEGCPNVLVWLDPNEIKKVAQKIASPNDNLAEPVLTYDNNPTRLVWKINVIDKDQIVKSYYVAGDYVYSGSS